MAYRDSTTAGGTSATPAVAVPTGVAVDDIVILVASIDASAADFGAGDFPTGFTELFDSNLTGDGQSIGVGWKRLTGADSGSYTFGSLGVSTEWVCQAIAFSGRHVTDAPTGTANLNSSGNTTPVTISATGLTASDGDDLLWIAAPDVSGSGVGNGVAPPTNYLEKEDAENGFSYIAMATRENVSAGATGTISGVLTLASGNSGWAGYLIRIPAAPAAAGQPTVKRWGGVAHMSNLRGSGGLW